MNIFRERPKVETMEQMWERILKAVANRPNLTEYGLGQVLKDAFSDFTYHVRRGERQMLRDLEKALRERVQASPSDYNIAWVSGQLDGLRQLAALQEEADRVYSFMVLQPMLEKELEARKQRAAAAAEPETWTCFNHDTPPTYPLATEKCEVCGVGRPPVRGLEGEGTAPQKRRIL